MSVSELKIRLSAAIEWSDSEKKIAEVLEILNLLDKSSVDLTILKVENMEIEF